MYGMGMYILDAEGNPKEVFDPLEWGRWMQTGDRIVARDTVDGVDVSTVFLGLDHNYYDEGPPILYETMVFGGEHDQLQNRYATYDQAVRGHAEVVAALYAKLTPKPPEDEWPSGSAKLVR